MKMIFMSIVTTSVSFAVAQIVRIVGHKIDAPSSGVYAAIVGPKKNLSELAK